MQNPAANTFIVPNTSQSLVGTMRHILDFVSTNLPQQVAAENIYFKLKVITTELLSNALKHVTDAESAIQVYIDHEQVVIQKTDHGTPFKPINGTFSANAPAGHIIPISSDAMHRVYAVVENGSTVRFACDEHNTNKPIDINEVSEHFGLLIITKTADQFTYAYDAASGLNTFNVSLKFY